MKIEKKIYISLLIAMVAITAISFSATKLNGNSVSELALNNITALANNESGGDNEVGTKCQKNCLTNIGYWNGVRYYCAPGTGGCYESTCISGSCVGMR